MNKDVMADQDWLLASIVKFSDDAIMSMSLDGVITSWNSAAVRMYGYSRQEIIGKPVTVIIPNDSANELTNILNVIINGKHLDHYETLRVRKDGRSILVSLTVSPIQDPDGTIIGASSVCRDVTALKQASGYVRSLIEASLDPLVTVSAEGKITDVNQGTVNVTGVGREELIGTDVSDYFTEPDKAREGYQRVFAEGAVRDYPMTIRHRDGTLTDVLYNASVYRDSSGHVLGVFAAARDVTALKQAQAAIAEQRVRDAERLKEMEHMEELERFQRLTIGRELKMIKLKKEIEILKRYAPADLGELGDER